MGRGPHTVSVRAWLRHACVGSPCGRDPRGVQVQPNFPPPAASRSLLGGGGRPLGSGGAEGRSCGSQARGGCGGGVGGPPPRPPAPSGVGLPSVVPDMPPRGILTRSRGGPAMGRCGDTHR